METSHCRQSTALVLTKTDRPKPILLVSAVAETAAETRDTYTPVTEPYAKCQGLVSTETIAEVETQKQSSYDVFVIVILILKVKLLSKSNLHITA